jgi:hypothetical protein
VEAVRAWLDAAGIKHGPVFCRIHKGGGEALTTKAMALVVKHHAKRAGSGRRNSPGTACVPARTNGASAFKLKEVSRHKSMVTLCGYIRRTELFKDHAGADFL